jgi:hypothetical protein
MTRKISAWLILILLLVVPFFNWRLGALLWMCAWVTYICQGVFNRKYPLQHEYENDDVEESSSDDKQQS